MLKGYSGVFTCTRTHKHNYADTHTHTHTHTTHTHTHTHTHAHTDTTHTHTHTHTHLAVGLYTLPPLRVSVQAVQTLDDPIVKGVSYVRLPNGWCRVEARKGMGGWPPDVWLAVLRGEPAGRN